MEEINLLAHVESKHIPVEGKTKLTVKSESKFPVTVRASTISGNGVGKSFTGSMVFNLTGLSIVTFASAEDTTVYYQIE